MLIFAAVPAHVRSACHVLVASTRGCSSLAACNIMLSVIRSVIAQAGHLLAKFVNVYGNIFESQSLADRMKRRALKLAYCALYTLHQLFMKRRALKLAYCAWYTLHQLFIIMSTVNDYLDCKN